MSEPFAPFEGAVSIPTGFADRARSVITVPAIDADAPDELKRRAKELAAFVEKREERLAKLDGSLRELIETPLEMAGVHQGAEAWREQLLDELAVELSLRRDVQALAAEYRQSLVDVLRRAIEASEQTKVEIHKKLVEMGWHPASNGALDPHSIRPGFLLSHPAVRTAQQRVDELQSKVNDRALAQSNAAAIAAVESKIKAARQKLAAV